MDAVNRNKKNYEIAETRVIADMISSTWFIRKYPTPLGIGLQ